MKTINVADILTMYYEGNLNSVKLNSTPTFKYTPIVLKTCLYSFKSIPKGIKLL